MTNLVYNFFFALGWIAFGCSIYAILNEILDSWNRAYYDFLSSLWMSVQWTCSFITDSLDHSSIGIRALDSALAIWFGYHAWKTRNNRKKRKNLLQRLGEKSKQKIQKMVDKLVRSPIPSPV